jgi:hypothetical protein
VLRQPPPRLTLSAAHGRLSARGKGALVNLSASILASLRNHVGKGIERTNEGSPARWRLKEAAN